MKPKYILAGDKATQMVITPVGGVAFEDGVASKFTQKQADYFAGKIGYLFSDVIPASEDEVPEDYSLEADAPHKPKLPVLQDKLADIIAFAEEHGVSLEGVNTRAKKPVLEAIYAHLEE